MPSSYMWGTNCVFIPVLVFAHYTVYPEGTLKAKCEDSAVLHRPKNQEQKPNLDDFCIFFLKIEERGAQNFYCNTDKS